MFGGLFIGFLVGLLIAFIAWASFTLECVEIKTKFRVAITILSFLIPMIISALIGIACTNYSIEKKIAEYEAAQKTYTVSIDDPNISDYERVAILQTVMDINQEIAASKTYINSFWAIGVTQENREAMNNIQLIGE